MKGHASRGVCLIALTLLLAGRAGPLGAQERIHVGGQAPTWLYFNAWPFRTYPDWRYIFLIKAADLPGTLFKITDLAFAVHTAPPSGFFTAETMQIRMAHTTLASLQPCFDQSLGAAPVQVFTGPMKWPVKKDTWSDLGLQTAFGHDGQRNIVIEIRYRRGSADTVIYNAATPLVERAYTHNRYSRDPFNEPCAKQPVPGPWKGPRVRFTIDRTSVLLGSDRVRLGGRLVLRLRQGPPDARYQLAASLGQGPAKAGPLTIGITPDLLFLLSLLLGPPVFNDYAGRLSEAGGDATATFGVPAIPVLAGLSIYHAAVVHDGRQILGGTNAVAAQIVP